MLQSLCWQTYRAQQWKTVGSLSVHCARLLGVAPVFTTAPPLQLGLALPVQTPGLPPSPVSNTPLHFTRVPEGWLGACLVAQSWGKKSGDRLQQTLPNPLVFRLTFTPSFRNA